MQQEQAGRPSSYREIETSRIIERRGKRYVHIAMLDPLTRRRTVTWGRYEDGFWWLVGLPELPNQGAIDHEPLERVALTILASVQRRGEAPPLIPDQDGRILLPRSGCRVRMPSGWRHRLLYGQHLFEEIATDSRICCLDATDRDWDLPLEPLLDTDGPLGSCRWLESGLIGSSPLPQGRTAWFQSGRLLPTDSDAITGFCQVIVPIERRGVEFIFLGSGMGLGSELPRILKDLIETLLWEPRERMSPAQPWPDTDFVVGLTNALRPESTRKPAASDKRGISVTGCPIDPVMLEKLAVFSYRISRRNAAADADRLGLDGLMLLPAGEWDDDPAWAVLPGSTGHGAVVFRVQSGGWWFPSLAVLDWARLLTVEWIRPELLQCQRGRLDLLPCLRLPSPVPGHGLGSALDELAVKKLENIGLAEMQFQCADFMVTSYYRGIYGYLGELSGRRDLLVGDEIKRCEYLLTMDADFNKGDSFSGWRFLVFLPGPDGVGLTEEQAYAENGFRHAADMVDDGEMAERIAHLQSRWFVVYAVPAGGALITCRQLAILPDQKVYCAPWSGELPVWNAIWNGGTWTDPPVWEKWTSADTG